MTIAAILANRQGEIITADSDMRVIEAIAILAERRIGAMPVLSGGQVVGIFSERDVIYGLNSEGAAALNRTVGEVMTKPAVAVAPDQRALAALSLMTQRRIRHLPVMEGDRMTGFVSIGDLVKYRIDRIEEEAMAMRDYIQGA